MFTYFKQPGALYTYLPYQNTMEHVFTIALKVLSLAKMINYQSDGRSSHEVDCVQQVSQLSFIMII